MNLVEGPLTAYAYTWDRIVAPDEGEQQLINGIPILTFDILYLLDAITT